MTTLEQDIDSFTHELASLVARGERLLRKMGTRSATKGVSPSQFSQADIIIDHVCKHYSLSARLLYSRTRKQPIVEARQVGMVLVRAKLGLSYDKVAVVFNKWDHGTVIHAERVINDLIATNSKFAVAFARLTSEIETLLKS